RTSFNGRGGIDARPRPEDEVAMRENHIQATSVQISHERRSSRNRNQFASVNHGQPSHATMNRFGSNRSNPQGMRNSNATTSTQPYNNNQQNRTINHQNRNIKNHPREESRLELRQQMRIQPQERRQPQQQYARHIRGKEKRE